MSFSHENKYFLRIFIINIFIIYIIRKEIVEYFMKFLFYQTFFAFKVDNKILLYKYLLFNIYFYILLVISIKFWFHVKISVEYFVYFQVSWTGVSRFTSAQRADNSTKVSHSHHLKLISSWMGLQLWMDAGCILTLPKHIFNADNSSVLYVFILFILYVFRGFSDG